MPKLTKQIVDSQGKKEKMYTIWDTEVKGFGCRIQPSGKKVYVFFYRMPRNHKLQYLTIGTHGSITSEIAREIVKGYSADVARGIDPKQTNISTQSKEEVEKSITFEDFFKIYHERHRCIEYKPSTLIKENYNIKNWIMPFFGTRILTEITTPHVLSFKDSMKNIPGAYNHCFRTIQTLFNKAEFWGYIPKNTNPCRNVSQYPEKKKERFLSTTELQQLENILNSQSIEERYSSYPINVLKLLIYTGCRLSEILSLKWEDIHLEDSYLLLKNAKTGERIVALNDISKSIFLKIEKYRDNPYIFPSQRTNIHLTAPTRLWHTVRKAINCEDVRIHDLRHSFASFAIKKGIDIFRVAKLLGHKDVKTTMRYAHISKEDMISASNVVGEMFGNG